MKSHLITASFALSALLAIAPRASAEFITLQYDHRANPQTATVQLNSATISNVPVGPFYFNDVNLPPNSGFPSPISTFCIEVDPLQPVYLTDPAIYNVVSPASAPTINSTAKANAIMELWGKYYQPAWASGSFAGSSNSIAFQFALWELVYDGLPAPGNTTSLANGNFRIGSSTPATTAQTWLNSLTGNPSIFATNFANYELVALVAPAGPGVKTQDWVQDQITMRPKGVIPAPPGIILAGIGFVGLLGRARLRRKAVSEKS